VVRIDAYSGMRELVAHMMDVHATRRIAFLRGPEEHESAEDRLRAFIEGQAAAGIQSDPRLIASPRAWNEGKAAIEELLDGRGLLPGRDFEALLASSDLQLYSALLVLQERGYTVPGDLLTAGFNDSIESRILSPSITTVRLPFDKLAERAFATLLKLFSGESVTNEETLPSLLVVRQSCGCISPSVREAGKRPASTQARGATDLGTALLSAAAKRHLSVPEERSAWLKPLAASFASALREDGHIDNVSGFLKTLERIMERLIRMGRDIGSWQDLLSSFRVEALAFCGPAGADRIEDLIGQARVIVSEAAVRADSVRSWKAGVTAQVMRELERDLIRLDHRKDLGEVLSSHLPALGIAAAYVVEEAGERSRLIAGYDEKGVLSSALLTDFDAADLLPQTILPPPSGKSWIVEPLCAGEGYFGRLIVRVGVRDSSVYEELRGALSSALQGLIAIDEIRNARKAAEKAELLKSRLLASVSAELRSPLMGIAETADEAMRVVTEGGGRSAPRVASALTSIRAAADRQLTLTDDLLDLARCEAGELQLDARLVRPERLISRARAVAGFPVAYREKGGTLPLVSGDSDRIARLLALLFERSRPAELSVAAEACFLAFSVRRIDGRPASSEDAGGLGRSVAFARRLVSAHLGRLEAIEESGMHVGWTLRLPYPTLGGGVASGAVGETQRLLLLSEGGEGGPEIGEAFTEGSCSMEKVAPGRLKAEAGIRSAFSALAWRPQPQKAASEAAVIRSLAKTSPFSTLPFLFFPEPDAEITAQNLGELLIALSQEAAGTVVVCDRHAERGAALASELTAPDFPAPLAVVSAASIARLGAQPSVIVLREADVGEVAAVRRTFATLARRPAIVFLCDSLEESSGLFGLETDPRTVIIHEGVFSASELALFIRELAQGRATLPPFTGAIVKKAQLYMQNHVSDDIARWQLAEAVNVSEDYLTRIFKKELGRTPWEYLIRLRIRAARRLLADSPSSLRDVAAATGFHDQAYFCRVFRRVEGRTPSAYRAESTE
jgi:AraC-like DNA-binding protein/signal transduction histidine kinase